MRTTFEGIVEIDAQFRIGRVTISLDLGGLAIAGPDLLNLKVPDVVRGGSFSPPVKADGLDDAQAIASSPEPSALGLPEMVMQLAPEWENIPYWQEEAKKFNSLGGNPLLGGEK